MMLSCSPSNLLKILLDHKRRKVVPSAILQDSLRAALATPDLVSEQRSQLVKAAADTGVLLTAATIDLRQRDRPPKHARISPKVSFDLDNIQTMEVLKDDVDLFTFKPSLSLVTESVMPSSRNGMFAKRSYRPADPVSASPDDGSTSAIGDSDSDNPGLLEHISSDDCPSDYDPLPDPLSHARPHRFLIIFSGPSTHAGRLRDQIVDTLPDAVVIEYDILNGVEQDVLRPDVQEDIFQDLLAGKYDRVFLAIPCSSFSIVRGDQLRSVPKPNGIEPFPAKWARYIRKHNRLISFSTRVLRICIRLKIGFLVENVARRSDMTSPAFWEEFADWAALWHVPFFKWLQLSKLGVCMVIALCSQGSEFQKYLELMASPDMLKAAIEQFKDAACIHERHADVAIGVDERGQSKAAGTARYPIPFNINAAAVLTSPIDRSASWSPVKVESVSTIDHPPPPIIPSPLPHSSSDDSDVAESDAMDTSSEDDKSISSNTTDTTPKKGRVMYTPFRLRRDLPKGVPVFRCMRPHIWSNPFSMQRNEDMRNKVCDAFEYWWKHPQSPVNEVASMFEVPIADSWKGHEIAGSPDRVQGMKQWRAVLSRGFNIALACDCSADQRCHTTTISEDLCPPCEPVDSPIEPKISPSKPKSKQPSAASASARHLHVGSSRPHADDGMAHMRQDRWAKHGSLRCLEPELTSVLRVEPFPSTNEPRSTPKPQPPTPMIAKEPSPDPTTDDPGVHVPGPFTTAQLIPAQAIEKVDSFLLKSDEALRRAAAGPDGWRVAKSLRPEPLVMLEQEALNPCGHGFAWRRVNPELPLLPDSMWEALLPSTEDDPPCKPADLLIHADRYAELAKKEGYDDQQVITWNKIGYPSPELPNACVLPPPHVGALKETVALAEIDARDRAAGFVSEISRFPIIWPLIADPANIVVQNGKPRLVIDKTMWCSASPSLPPYNFVIDLDEQHRMCGRLVMPTVGMFARALAILMSALVENEETQLIQAKFDLKSFFRVHPKQRKYTRLSGRVLRGGFDVDFRVNFGETDAPLHTCRASDGLTFFCRCEFARIDKEYPTRIKSIQAWLLARRLAKESTGIVDDQQRFLWDVTFFIMFFVDDGGLCTFNDKLLDTNGAPKIDLVTQPDGSIKRLHESRMDLMFKAAIGICEWVNHQCPLDKRDRGSTMVLLGVENDLHLQRRLLPRQKAISYQEMARMVKKGRTTLPNKLTACDYKIVNSLVHRLLHASSVIALGRSHLFYIRQALKRASPLRFRAPGSPSSTFTAVIITKACDKELDWWIAQLADAHLHGIPLASRFSFPGASFKTTLVRYGDASREPTQEELKSGGGAWTVLDDIFFWIHVVWTADEVARYSINVLEAHIRDATGERFLEKAAEMGKTITHTIAYIDNSTAENIAESGRASTEMLHLLNTRRLERLQARGVFETNERVTSVDNDVADLISRGDIEEALRFPRDCELKCVQLFLTPEQRALPSMQD